MTYKKLIVNEYKKGSKYVTRHYFTFYGESYDLWIIRIQTYLEGLDMRSRRGR